MFEAVASERSAATAGCTFYLRKANCQPNICIELAFPSSPSPLCAPSLPTFNADGRHYTPSFMLPCDQSRYREHGQVYLGIHLRKSAEMQQQKSILLVPKPSKNNSYCCVCKTPFDDYLTHLNTPAHTLLMRKSDYHLRIEDLCKGFGQITTEPKAKKPVGAKRGRPAKTKGICKLPTLTSKRSLSGKETDESNRPDDLANQLVA